tara:strand:+ start:1258 stop:2607 length:1350 start_codon:yes stop_codon:yes gene_type:complete
MKIKEVQMQEATPNYEVNPAQARLSAIAVKLMDKADTVTDTNLQIALTRVAQHLPEYGIEFGPKSIQDLLDIVNSEGKHAEPDMPMDNKNPIKVTKETLMKMMAYGQKMVDKEGTVKPDLEENGLQRYTGIEKYGKEGFEALQQAGRDGANEKEKGAIKDKYLKNDIHEDVEDYEKVTARQMHKRLRTLIKDIAILNAKINELSDMDNGDLTDQISTMFKHVQGLYGVVGRAQKIVPVYEGYGSMVSPETKARIDAKVPAPKQDPKTAKLQKKIDGIKKMKKGSVGKTAGEMNEAIPTSEFDYDLMKFYKKVMKLEDENQHGKVAEMLVQLYGTGPESMVIRGINGMHSNQGSIMPEQQRLRDMISNKYYKKLEQEVEELKKTSPAYTMRNEGAISDLFKTTTAEKRAKEQTGSAYDAAMVDKHTKKYEKQGLEPEDARKYAYRKVFGK